MISVVLMFVTERYRLAAVPGLLLFAAFAVERLFASVAAAKFSAAAVQCAALAAAALLVSIPQSDPAIWALATYNAGRQALDRGDIASAESQLELALRYAPNNAEANFALGNVRLAQGNGLAAEERYVAALRIDRRHKGALTNLGVLALDAENTETAEMYFRQVIAWEPRGAKGHFLLAKTLLKKGDREGAALEVNRAIELEPARPEFQKLRDEIAGRE
jgi:Flp pilus assembly protein TadD